MTEASILFVDDDPSVLSSMRRMLYPMRAQWRMAFASSGDEAMEMLSMNAYDVVVSDMRMPGMNGAQLLTRVRARYPTTARVILSGHSEVALAVQTINVAHQFLNKPCDIDELVRVIRKTISLRRLLGRGELCALANDTIRMPSLPRHYIEITQEIAKQDASVDRVAAIVQEDPAMTVTILRLVNSGFFGRPSRVLTVKEAIGLLGLELLRSLTLATGLFVKFESTPSFSIERFAARSARVAWLARMMATDAGVSQNVREQTFVSAMLCDIGLLLLHTSMPAYANYVEQARSQNTDIAEIERIMIGADHAEIGAYLMALWGFEDDIVEAIVHHHHPRKCAGDSPKDPLAFVHCADALTEDPDHCSKREVDVVFLASMGLDGYLPKWREMAKTPRITEA